jgi:ceramide glucosyltransferase
MHTALQVLSLVAAVGGLCGLGYYLLCIWSARTFLKSRPPGVSVSYAPPVSILKPLKGVDPAIYEAFCSHCLQDYPEYEIVFGVSDRNDAAILLVQQLQQEFPRLTIKLVIADKLLGTNGKVSTLAQMLPHARFDHLLISDSDIRVESSYLHRVMAPFIDPQVGMVTCLYRGIAESTIGSRLEALGISTDFSAGVLAARVLQGVKFGLGSTMAFRRESLTQIGGFEPLVDYLADDYELGSRIAALGQKVIVSDVIVDHHLPAYKFREFLAHQLRWARAIRDSRKLEYLGLGFTFGMPWALLALLFSRGAKWAWLLFAVLSFVRLMMAINIGVGVMRDRQVLRDLLLLPLRDIVAVGTWIASFAGHKVRWRGDEFFLQGGKLRRMEAKRELS